MTDNPCKPQTVAWIDWIKVYAVLSIIFHHWLYFLGRSGSAPIDKCLDIVEILTGNGIHLFFIASGFGLIYSHSCRPISWKRWFSRRLTKILVPYWIVVAATYLCVTAVHGFAPKYLPESPGFSAFVQSMLLMQNFFREATLFNLSLWFIPNIVGLYCVFPLLCALLRKTGERLFLILTFFMSMGSILTVSLLGGEVNNHHSIFPFFIFQFSLGMFLGQRRQKNATTPNKPAGAAALLAAGVLFYATSYLLSVKTAWGDGFNKPFTALGILLIVMAIVSMLRRRFSVADGLCARVAGASYYMYLIHFPLYYYFLRQGKAFFPQNFALRTVLFFVTYAAFAAVMYHVSGALKRNAVKTA